MDLADIIVRALLILAAWIVLSLPLAVLVGRMIAFGNGDLAHEPVHVPAPQSDTTSWPRAA